jgi:hypothetical protein
MKKTALVLLLLITCVLAVYAVPTERAKVVVIGSAMADLTVGGTCGKCVTDCLTACLAQECQANPPPVEGFTAISCYQGEECDYAQQVANCTSSNDGNCKVTTKCVDKECKLGCSTENVGVKHKCTMS